MYKLLFGLFVLILFVNSASGQYINPYETYDIRANNGTYLGNTANRYDTNSIYNPYGPYGSPYSNQSMNNPYGPYGSPYSSTSPNNPYAVPARIYPQNNPTYYYNYGGNGY